MLNMFLLSMTYCYLKFPRKYCELPLPIIFITMSIVMLQTNITDRTTIAGSGTSFLSNSKGNSKIIRFAQPLTEMQQPFCEIHYGYKHSRCPLCWQTLLLAFCLTLITILRVFQTQVSRMKFIIICVIIYWFGSYISYTVFSCSNVVSWSKLLKTKHDTCTHRICVNYEVICDILDGVIFCWMITCLSYCFASVISVGYVGLIDREPMSVILVGIHVANNGKHDVIFSWTEQLEYHTHPFKDLLRTIL